MQAATRRKILIASVAVLAGALIVSVVSWAVRREKPVPEIAPVITEPNREIVIREVEKIVEVEKVYSAELINDGLRDMGLMITEEYYFTDVMSYSSVKKLFQSIELKFTESYYLASYDGVVAAGVDFTRIRVEKDETEKTITVTLPAAEIQYAVIDEDSFRLYSEKEGIGNDISLRDFNTSLVELKAAAEEKAVERGLLERAEENAKTLIQNFVWAVIDPTEYTLLFAEA